MESSLEGHTSHAKHGTIPYHKQESNFMMRHRASEHTALDQSAAIALLTSLKQNRKMLNGHSLSLDFRLEPIYT